MTGPVLEVCLGSYLSNLQLLLDYSSCDSMTPVIKADAYGHGAVALAKCAETEFDAHVLPFFCVARLNEARTLRAEGIQRPIAILSEDCVKEFADEELQKIIFFVSSAAEVQRLSMLPMDKRENVAGVVFHLNSGMNRLGFDCKEDSELQQVFESCKTLLEAEIDILGFSTHLACGEEKPEFLSQQQAELFEGALLKIKKQWTSAFQGRKFPALVMLSNSPGSGWHLSPSENCFRPGILSYGLFADEETKNSALRDMPHLSRLKAIASLRAPLRQIRHVKAGDGVSYGHRFRCEDDKILAVLSYGYADGLRRSLSTDNSTVNAQGGLRFFIRGEGCPIVGRVTMDMVLVDVTDHSQVDQIQADLEAGQQIWANWISSEQTAEWQASTLGTISYEILCNVGSRVFRDYKA